MTLPLSAAGVLGEHVAFECECIDRVYCNAYVPKLAYPVERFLSEAAEAHLGLSDLERGSERRSTELARLALQAHVHTRSVLTLFGEIPDFRSLDLAQTLGVLHLRS